ncbi:MAG: preprotein translocase subunit SecE [Gammaproteobacteria bacterium]|nr:preprotein translocase subunit SecE [Gammaproteobacteria bacterium]MCP5458858.1 preprotein translocase subunit SecE [Gammaproteobacteria bacterium]
MNLKSEPQVSRNELVKLISAGVLVLLGLSGFYYFADYLLVGRILGLLLAVGVAGFIVITTEPGAQLVGFFKEVRMELRKVVWPTRTETLQTSLAVIVMVVVMGIFLWLLDILLFWMVRLLTGQ